VKAAQKMLRLATSVGTVSVVYSVLLFYASGAFLGMFRREKFGGGGNNVVVKHVNYFQHQISNTVRYLVGYIAENWTMFPKTFVKSSTFADR
jgi:hypothetical protein